MPVELTQEQVSAYARSQFAAKGVPYPASGDAKYRALYGSCLTGNGQVLYPYGGAPLYLYCDEALSAAVASDIAAWRPRLTFGRAARHAVAGPSTPPTPIEPPNGIFDQTEVATYATEMYAFYGVPANAGTAAHYQALYAQCLEKYAGPSFNAAANNAALYNQCNAALQLAVVSDIAAYRKAHPPPSPPAKKGPMTPPSAKQLSQSLASVRKSKGVLGMVGGLRAMRQVGFTPSPITISFDKSAIAAAQQALNTAKSNLALSGGFDPTGVLLNAVNQAQAALNQANAKLAADQGGGGVLASPPGGGGVKASPPGGGSGSPQPSKWTTPILGGLLLLAGVGIVYAYDKPSGRARA